MDFVKNSFFLITVLVMSSFISLSFGNIGEFDDVCAYTQDGRVIMTLKQTADANNYNILGEPTEEESETLISDVDSKCVELVLDNGINCKLPNNDFDDSRFYISIDGTNLPQRAICEYESCSSGGCAWNSDSQTSDDTEVTTEDDDSTPTTVVIIGEEETYEDINLEDMGLQPFDEVDRSVCETPNSPYDGIFMSKQSCEQRGTDCAYDPYRVGILTQIEGDSRDENIFSTLSEDSMCVSKSTRIKSCEDIRSKQLCNNYESLTPSENSLMEIYGCEWREVKSNVGICMTSNLYYDNLEDYNGDNDDKIINVVESLQRKNFIKNPLFEVMENSNELYYWEGDYELIDNSNYNNIYGTQRIALSQGDSISQLVSGIPFNSIFQIKVITTKGSEITPIVDSSNQDISITNRRPLFETQDYSSNLEIISYDFQNSIDSSNRIVSFRADSNSEILGVSFNIKSSDSSSTQSLITSNIYPESVFVNNTFDCSLCSLGLNTGFCNETKINSLSKCELISNSANDPYISSAHDSSNPYTTYTGLENIFVEEDMTFCGLYSKQETCENPNSKLNSVISAYHNSETLCKWNENPSLKNGGFCYKDSLGDNVPDTVEGGKLSYEKDYLDDGTYFTNYDLGSTDELNSFNDFQYSCDSMPPQVVIEPYKKVIDSEELVTKRIDDGTLNELGVVDFYLVRIENYVSPACDVFENFESNVELILESSEENSFSVLASDFFPEYENSIFFKKIYSRVEFNNLLENYIYNTEEFKESGNIKVFDSSGNMQKNEITLNIGESLNRLDLNFTLVPQTSKEVYKFSKIKLLDLNSQMSDFGSSCNIQVIDSDENSQIMSEKNISISSLLDEGVSIGEEIGSYESNRVSNEEDEREEFQILVNVICEDVFDREVSKLKTYDFLNSDGIIVHKFDDGAFNPNNVPYLNIQTRTMPLNISARAGLSCSNSYIAQNGNKISDLGPITFSDTSSIEDFPLRYSQDLDFSAYVSRDGIYEYVLDCELGGERFERKLDFEFNTQVPELSSVKLIEKNEAKWADFNGEIYIDAVDENLLSSEQNMVNTNDFNNYLKNKIIMQFENKSEILEVRMCNSNGLNIFLDNPIISGNVLNPLNPTGCSVNYIEEESLIEFTSNIILRNKVGNVNSGELVTYFDVKGPNINLNTKSGGSTVKETVYFNNNNPVFVLDLGLSDFRKFSCNVDLIVNSNVFSQSFDSTNGQIEFKIEDLTNQDVLSIPNVNLEFDLTCQDELFEREDSLQVSLEQDFDRPEILDINFVDINENWGIPEVGNFFTISSDVEIDIKENEEYISCDYEVTNENPQGVINAKDVKSIDGTNTNKISVDNESIIKKQNTGPASLLIISNSPPANKMDFSIRVDCKDGAGNTDSKVFDNYQLNLFNYGEIQVIGDSSSENNLELEIRSLSPLKGLSLNIEHGDLEENFYSGTISALSPTFTQEGGVYVARISDAGSLLNFPTSRNYPFSVSIPYGTNSFRDEFSVLIDNENPQINLIDNSNDDNVIFGDILTGELRIIDNPEFSKGLSLINIELLSENSELIDAVEYNENLGSQEIKEFYYDNLTPGIYQLKVNVEDKSGNNIEEFYTYEMSESFGVNLLGSENVEIQDSYPITWYTQDPNPILKFETAREVQNCYLSPGANGGYIGSQYNFVNTQENTFELNTQELNDFEIISNKNKVIIGCERLDKNNEVDEVGVFLHLINGVPDYTLEFDWGRTIFISPGNEEELIEFDIIQRGQFREVTCDLNVEGVDANIELNNNRDGSIGDLSGNITLREGAYTFNLVCETPFGIEGPTKSYRVDVVKEDFSINLESMMIKATGDEIEVNNSPILLPMESLSSESSSEFEIQFTTNYQGNLNCSVDTTKSGVVNFITSLFVNTEIDSYTYPQQKGLFGADIEIDSSTNSIDISCNKGTEFNSGVFNFPVEIFDKSTYQIDDISIAGER